MLQERVVRRIGENRQRGVDVRVIAATNRALADDVAEGRFRRDLYYRLHVVDLHIPPLRERLEDLGELAQSFLTRIAENLQRAITGYTAAALEVILRRAAEARRAKHRDHAATVIDAPAATSMDAPPPHRRERARLAVPGGGVAFVCVLSASWS